MAALSKETKGLEHDAGSNHEPYKRNISTPHQRMWSIVVDPNTKITFEELFPGVVGGWHRLAIHHAALTNKLNDSSFCRTTISVVREEEPGDKTLKQPLVLCTLVPMIIEQVRLDYTLALDRKAGYILVEGPNPVNISMEAAPSANERVNGTGKNKALLPPFLMTIISLCAGSGPNNAKTQPIPSLSTSLSLEKANFPGNPNAFLRRPKYATHDSVSDLILVDLGALLTPRTDWNRLKRQAAVLLCSAPMSSSTLNSEITSSIIQCVFNPRIEGSSTTNLSREPRFYQRPNFSAVGDQETMGHRPSSVVPQAPSYKQSYLRDKPRYRRYRNYNANDHNFSSDRPPMKNLPLRN
ncbi:uncharacterized protein C8R40DRAFT_1173923 [Lentinula edodes]|uniref:uncharacterized protein n=1 Tax=Lentinula edodes TaxID=5353 RepID=UPI001E8CC374|nr:uncharacterized protein C8R40DRAFT_1173923 [Lentinula edodes]KAH7872198.1 hypothetical protein C8R40DRAFT_1173923 [Lentinula edodes]